MDTRYDREEKSEVYSRNPGFTETRLRPLARRRDNTAAPLLVFMRERNPCFFERLRRFGWKVRLGMKNSCS
jgi:hypothetical protein